MAPRIEIHLNAITHNTRVLTDMCMVDSIAVAGVSKAAAGDIKVAKAMIDGGVKEIADSRMENLASFKGIGAPRLLLRPPEPRMARSAVEVSESSLNSEVQTIRELGHAAAERGEEHGIIVMIDLGDRREGIMPDTALDVCEEVADIEGTFLRGIGTNLACFAGVIPTPEKMAELSEIAERIEEKTKIELQVISGGNSANIPMLIAREDQGRVNHLRLGESILLGLETVGRSPIPGLRTDAFVLKGEFIEVKEKPSAPDGRIGQDAFGGVPTLPSSRGPTIKGIVNLGRQDLEPMDLKPLGPMKVLGGSSDHVILDLERPADVGQGVSFIPGYGSLLRAMTSPYVEKVYV